MCFVKICLSITTPTAQNTGAIKANISQSMKHQPFRRALYSSFSYKKTYPRGTHVMKTVMDKERIWVKKEDT